MHFSILKKKLYKNLKNKNVKLYIVESITGGYLTSEIIKIPGASEIFLYGIVSYSNKSKKSILGIKNLISSHGVVSKEVAEEMVKKYQNFRKKKSFYLCLVLDTHYLQIKTKKILRLIFLQNLKKPW